MAHKKGGGSSRNGRDSNPQYLGIKAYAGEAVHRRQYFSPSTWDQILSRNKCWVGKRLHTLRQSHRHRQV